MIDLHCDTLLALHSHGCVEGLRRNSYSVDIERMHACGMKVQDFAIFVHFARTRDIGIDPWGYFHDVYSYYSDEMTKNSDLILPLRKFDDIQTSIDSGKVCSLLSLEEGGIVDGKMDRVDELFRLGVRLITLTWNFDNCIGHTTSDKREEAERGLTPFGFEMLAHMNEIGIIPDVSHLSDGGFWDVARHSKKPFCASHSNARAVTGHKRNLTDEMLRALAEKGGITGLNFCPSFLFDPTEEQLNTNTAPARIEDMVRHVRHIVDVAGINVMALGTDFNGIDGILEIEDCANLYRLFDALGKAGFTDDEIDLVREGNAMRFLKEAL